MPGAGTLKATQYVYGVAPKDGTDARDRQPRHGRPIRCSTTPSSTPTKLTWLGSVTSETSVCATWKTSPVKTWDDMFKREFTPRRQRGRRRPRHLRADPAQRVRRQGQARHRLSGRQRHQPRHGARRGRRPLRLVVVEPQEPEDTGCRKINLLVQFALEKNADLPDVPLDDRARGERRAAAGAAAFDRRAISSAGRSSPRRTFRPIARRRCARPSTPP